MAFYKMQIKAHNATAHHILKNEVDLILPKFYKGWKNKRGIFSAIITGFIGLAFEGISSFLHHKRHKAVHKVVKAMSISMDAQRNKLMHLENTLVMYRIWYQNFRKFSKDSSCPTQQTDIIWRFIHRTDFSSLQTIFANAWHTRNSTFCS